MLGVVADCATPRYYFKTGFFFGTPECAIEDYTDFACANETLGDAEHLLDNASVYAKMVSLARIDVSGNSRLSSLPESWSAVPHNLVVSASRNPKLVKVPYVLCNDTANITLDVSLTPFAKHIEWSGQLHRADPSTRISPSCQHSVREALTLDISDNDLNCNLNECDFQNVVVQLRNLSFLDLSNNSIKVINAPLITMTKHFHHTKLSVNMKGNPVDTFDSRIEPLSIIKFWSAIIDDSNFLSFYAFTIQAIDAQDNSIADMVPMSTERFEIQRADNLNWKISDGVDLLPKKVWWIYWEKFKLTLDGAKTLALFLPKSGVTKIHFDEMEIGDEAGVLLCSNLPAGLHNLYLSRDTIGDATALAVAKALPQSQISFLTLSSNNIGPIGIKALATALTLTNFTTFVNFRDNVAIGDDGAIALVSALPHTNVHSLDLSMTSLSLEGMKMLAGMLNNSQVQYFYCSLNDMGDKGAAVWASALPKLNLRVILLTENRINDDGALALAAALPESSLTHLILKGNNITDVGVKAFAAVLLLSRIQFINLAANKGITEEGLAILREVNGKKNVNGQELIVVVQGVGFCLDIYSDKCQIDKYFFG